MTDKVNGSVASGQALTGGLDFYKVRTTLDIRATGDLTEASQKRLNKLVETISLRAQPVIISEVKVATEAAPADLVGTNVEVYELSFGIEKKGAWEMDGTANPSLAETLDGVEGFEFDGIAVGNIAVAKL